MKYLKISNQGTVNRLFFEIIGLSTKRENAADPANIGHKGSGTKLAPVAALRLGLDLTIASSDNDGPYMLSYEQRRIAVETSPFHEIDFVYTTPDANDPKATVTTRKSSKRVIEAFQGWDQPIGDDGMRAFKALREFICNAYDHDKAFVTEGARHPEFAKPGETVVYLKFTDELKAMLRRREQYFKFMAKDQQLIFGVTGLGEMYRKSESDKTRLFLLGVLADCSAHSQRVSLFDYSFNKKELLSEERVLTSQLCYSQEVGRLFGHLSDPTIAQIILANVEAGKAPFEEYAMWLVPGFTDASRSAWLDALHKLFGTKIAIASTSTTINENARQIVGYKLIGLPNSGFEQFLLKLGIPRAADVMPKFEEFEIMPFTVFDENSRLRFLAAFQLFAINNPVAAKLPLYFYLPKTKGMKKIQGFAGIGDKAFEEIWIGAKSQTELPDVRSLFETLMHEARHCLTKMGDYERGFVDWADHEIAVIAFREAGYIAFGDEGLVPPRGDDKLRPVFGPPETRRKELEAGGALKIPEYKRK